MKASIAFHSPVEYNAAAPAASSTFQRPATGHCCAFRSVNVQTCRTSLQVGLARVGSLTPRLSKRTSKICLVRASANDEDSSTPIAPFQPVSPTGQFLTQLLQSHPHLVPAAVEVELEKLSEDRVVDDNQGQANTSGSELVLYKRIAELKAQEKRRALEDIIYTLIVQKFVESGVSMVPSLSYLTTLEKPWPLQTKQLESVHPMEVLEMIWQHLTLVLGPGGGTDYFDQNTYAKISKVRVGQVYAASLLYGYFLRRVYQRFRLEKSMKMLPPGVEESSSVDPAPVSQPDAAAGGAAGVLLQGMSGFGAVQPPNVKPTKLQSYIKTFDIDTLQKFATLRSRESLGVLEKQTEALFGRPEIRIAPDGTLTVNKDEELRISFGGLKGLVLEAAAFGSFLWDVESYVDSCYSFVAN